MGIFNVLNIALDAILPRRERRARTESRTFSDIPLSPASHQLLGSEIQTVMDYRQSTVEDLIRSLKYDKSGHAAKLCAAALEDYLREEISSLRAFSPRRILLIPIPLHADRHTERGFNQIEAVLKHLPREFHNGQLSFVTPALKRIRATKQQTHLSRDERLRNVENAFEIPYPSSLADSHVFLIDDVTTTGATLVEAGKSFKKNEIPVTLLALGRA